MKLKWDSFRVAIEGIVFMMRTQVHARWHLLATLATLVLAAALRVSREDWLALLVMMAVVWVAEAVNTALEQVCDAITRARHPRIGLAKDVAAGAVLIAAVFASAVGGIVFLPKLWPVH